MKEKLIKNGPLLLLMVAFSACDNDDNNGIRLQSHDENEFMTVMHDMNAKMDAMTMTGDADHDFVMMMTIHHQGAIDMSNKLLEKGMMQPLNQWRK